MKSLNLDIIELKAETFRLNEGFGVFEPINMQTILQKKKILTVFRPLSSDFYGLSLKSTRGNCFTLINSETTLGRQNFTIAHELYHLYYDENPIPHFCSRGERNKSEKNADMFAAALLMPKNGLLKEIPSNEINNNISLATLLRLEQYYQVSWQSLLFRLKTLKLITEDRLQEFLAVSVKQLAQQNGYDTSIYSNTRRNFVIGDFGIKARKLFEDEKISEGHYNELLNLITNYES